MPSEIKAVFFDHDDTLYATREAKWAQHIKVAKNHYNIELSEEILKTHYGMPFSQFVKVLYQTEDVDGAMANIALYRDEFPKVIYPESIATLTALRKMGMLTGVVTATTRKSLSIDHELGGITPDLFDYIQTEEDTNFHKPDPHVFEPAIKWLAERDIKPNQVVYVGDGIHDLKAAIGAGFNFIGVETGLTTPEDFLAGGGQSVIGVGRLLDHDYFRKSK